MVSIGDHRLRPGAKHSRPGGNITGNTILGPEMAAKRVQPLQEVLPKVSRVAFLRNPDNASNAMILEELLRAAKKAGVTVIPIDVRSVEDFDAAVVHMLTQHPDVMITTNDPLQQLHMERIIAFQANNRLPGMFQARENVVAGGLMSYGASLPDLFKRAAGYAHRILTGTKPSDLPVEPTIFQLVVNLKTAKALGLTIPEAFLLRTDEVIE